MEIVNEECIVKRVKIKLFMFDEFEEASKPKTSLTKNLVILNDFAETAAFLFLRISHGPYTLICCDKVCG